jgi:putative transposase
VANKEQNPIIRHITADILKKKIKHQEKENKVLKRLIFIKLRYDGFNVAEASEKIGISTATGYLWQDQWNKNGYEGLIPKYAGGRPPKLSAEDKTKLKEYLNEKDHWSLKEVKNLIFFKFGVQYSDDQIRRILRSFDMFF